MAKRIGDITAYLNVFKKESEPDYRGKLDIEINGYTHLLDISLWINQDVNNFPVHMSGQVTERDIR